MKKIWTIVIAVIAFLNLVLLGALAFSLGWGLVLTILGISLATAAVLVVLGYGLYRLSKKKWSMAYIPPLVVFLLGLIFEIVITAWDIFPGLSGLVPTMIVLVALTGSVMTLVIVRVLELITNRKNKKV